MQQFIDPLTLARVKDMPLVAKTVAQGFLHGLHASMQRGSGIEFSQYRLYEPGDALARIDWKLFARSDRYFVREAERESNINLWLVLDASDSMLQISQHSARENGWNKLDYGRYLLATVAYLAQQQGDAVGLLGLSTANIDYLPALSGGQQLQKIMLQLARMESGQMFPSVHTLQAQLNKVRSNGLIFIVSDFYQQNNEIIDFIRELSNANTEVVAIQLSCQDEINFPFSGQIRFEDLESHEQVLVAAVDVKQDYLQQRAAFNQQLKETLAQLDVQHFHANIDEPMDQTLYDFLAVRQKAG
jgi:uncharacterized protein (DUF58 family)